MKFLKRTNKEILSFIEIYPFLPYLSTTKSLFKHLIKTLNKDLYVVFRDKLIAIYNHWDTKERTVVFNLFFSENDSPKLILNYGDKRYNVFELTEDESVTLHLPIDLLNLWLYLEIIINYQYRDIKFDIELVRNITDLDNLSNYSQLINIDEAVNEKLMDEFLNA